MGTAGPGDLVMGDRVTAVNGQMVGPTAGPTAGPVAERLR